MAMVAPVSYPPMSSATVATAYEVGQYSANPPLALGMAVLATTPVSSHLVAPSPVNPEAVRSPATKPWFTHGSTPGPLMSGVRAAMSESGAKMFSATILLRTLQAFRLLMKVMAACWVCCDGMAPPLAWTRVTQSAVIRLPGDNPTVLVRHRR